MGTSKYLEDFNRDITEKEFDDWYIDDLFFSYKNGEIDDDIASIIRKYFSIDYKRIAVNDSDAKLILECYDNQYNVLLRTVLDYLLACSHYREKSNLVEDCKEYISMYFERILEIHGGLPAHDLERVLKWTVCKYPLEKPNIGKLIFDNIISKKYKTFRYFSLSEYLLRDKELSTIMTLRQYIEILDVYYVLKPEPSEIYLYSQIYNAYLKYLKTADKTGYKSFLKKYVDFVFNNMDLIDDHTKQTELQKVRQYMDLLKTFSDEEYLFIDKELERVNKKQLEELQTITIGLPEEKNKKIREFIQKNEKIYKSLNSVDKIRRLMVDAIPISLAGLKAELEDEKRRPLAIFKENILDSDGRVINYDELDANQELSLKSTQRIGIQIELFFDMVFSPFYRTFKIDLDAESFINEVMSNNEMIDSTRSELISKLFVSFFAGDYEHSVFDIVLELEESLRYYFKSQGLNTFKRDGSRDVIGLNNIFNDFKNNSYRDKLFERIDEDYYFTLKWFLTDEYGFDLRDKISHRLKSQNLYKTKFAIYIVLQIFILYCGFERNK